MFKLVYILIKHISKRRVSPLQNTLYQELSIFNTMYYQQSILLF